jgi:uncharacterized lipoprotein YmbA
VRTSVVVLVLALAAGCFTRTAAEPRFFRPDSALLGDVQAGDPQPAPLQPMRVVRLRAVDGAPFLGERVVWRSSALEYGFYEQRRWHELPASYVERALLAAFRKSARVRVAEDMHVPSLRIVVSAFDDVLAPKHVASVEATASLRDVHGELLLERPFAAEVAIGGDDPATMAMAMGGALDMVATQIADAVADAAPPLPDVTSPVKRPARNARPSRSGGRS